MKKNIIIIVLLILGIIICYGVYFINSDKDNNSTILEKNTIKKEDIPIVEPEEDVWIDDNPITVGIYKYNDSIKKRQLINEYSNVWKYHTDIVSFNVMFTNYEEISSGKLADVYESFLENYNNIDNYRIGYIISFDTKEENILKQILRPSDTEDFYDYIEVYLYDAIYHRNDKWYSHTTEKEYNENTLLEGIKLTSGVNVNDIISDINLTAFSYDEDDFDENGMYKGVSKYSVTIKRS